MVIIMVYTEIAGTAAVSRNISHTTTKYPLWWIFKNTVIKKGKKRSSYSHSFRITCDISAVSLLASGK